MHRFHSCILKSKNLINRCWRSLLWDTLHCLAYTKSLLSWIEYCAWQTWLLARVTVWVMSHFYVQVSKLLTHCRWIKLVQLYAVRTDVDSKNYRNLLLRYRMFIYCLYSLHCDTDWCSGRAKKSDHLVSHGCMGTISNVHIFPFPSIAIVAINFPFIFP